MHRIQIETRAIRPDASRRITHCPTAESRTWRPCRINHRSCTVSPPSTPGSDRSSRRRVESSCADRRRRGRSRRRVTARRWTRGSRFRFVCGVCSDDWSTVQALGCLERVIVWCTFGRTHAVFFFFFFARSACVCVHYGGMDVRHTWMTSHRSRSRALVVCVFVGLRGVWCTACGVSGLCLCV